MKRIVLTLSFCMAAASLLADDAGVANAGSAESNTNGLNSQLQRASYALGMLYGHNLHQHGADVDFDTFVRGFKDAQSGGSLLMTPAEMQKALTEYQQTLIAEQRHKRELLAVENGKKSEEFLAENKKKRGVHVLPDGIQYKIITEGKGPLPGSNDVALINYRGTLLDGKEFGKTADGNPVEESVRQPKIKGLQDVLPLMKAGSVWEVVVPPDLAYGPNGLGMEIPPNAVLIYRLELVSSGPPTAVANPPLTSDIIAVPSAEEMKKGKQPYTLKPGDVQKMQQQLQKTNR